LIASALIIGEGQLADFVFEELSGHYMVIRQADLTIGALNTVELVLMLHDEGDPSFFSSAEEVLQLNGIPWLRGFTSKEEGVVGPLVRPGMPGCSECADLRQRLAGSSHEISEQQLNMLLNGGKPCEFFASRTSMMHIACLIASEARRVLEGQRARTEGKIYYIDLKTLASSLHFFLPDSLCAVCGRLPDDSAEAARITLQPNPKINADSYRTRRYYDLKEVLIKDYFDERTGLLNNKMIDAVSPFANVCVNLPLILENELTAGRTHSYAESELTAILEGLERYCGHFPRSKKTVIKGSYRNLEDKALNPVTVGVYTKEQYAQPDFPFKPFDPDLPIDWVWGYSFLQERSILVPESLAYYSTAFGQGFVNEASNGCALGGSLEEAVFHGILEVVERDAFLMTWYAQLPVPRLAPDSANDKELRLMSGRLQAVTGYHLHLYNMTMENGIPSIWAIAKNSKSEGANLLCAAGAHLNPMKAAKSAIHELAAMLPMINEEFETNREDCMSMLRDSSLVQRMEDHALLYSLPQAQERLQFLLDNNRPLRTFDEEFKSIPKHADLSEELKDMIQLFRHLKLDVIVVNQTAPETLRNGLFCVKVLIPGMLPMSFGHHLTRLTGLERLSKMPVELGYTRKPVTFEQINPFPHPFP
jgi:ribosomal protein S12 methylthiotransferase accessory factor